MDIIEQNNDVAEAVVADDNIVITLPIDQLYAIADYGWSDGVIDCKIKITNLAVFAQEICKALNAEEEDGTTLIHRMFDSAIGDCINDGVDGFELLEGGEDEDVCLAPYSCPSNL